MSNNQTVTGTKINISQTNMKTNHNRLLENELSQDDLCKTLHSHFCKFDDEEFFNSKELSNNLKEKKKNADKLISNKDKKPFENVEISLKDYCQFKNFTVEHPKNFSSSNKIVFNHKVFTWRRYSVQLDKIILFGSCLGEIQSGYKILKECLNSITHESKERDDSFFISQDHKQLKFNLTANLSKNEIKIEVSIKFTAELDLENNCLESYLNSLEQIVVNKQESYYKLKNKQDKIRRDILKSSQEYSLIYEKTNQK